MAANDKERSKVIIFDPNAKTENIPRPNHPDYKVPSELAAEKWSGVRHNPLTLDLECWIEGEIVFFSTAVQRALIKDDFKIKYVEFFGMFPNFDKEGNII